MKIYTVHYLFNGPDSTHAEVIGVYGSLKEAQYKMNKDFEYQAGAYDEERLYDFPQIWEDNMNARIQTKNNEYLDWTIQEFDLVINQE